MEFISEYDHIVWRYRFGYITFEECFTALEALLNKHGAE